jgi:hypothetical protein
MTSYYSISVIKRKYEKYIFRLGGIYYEALNTLNY